MERIVGGNHKKGHRLNPTAWNTYVENYAREHHIPYTEAIVDWKVSNDYRATHGSKWNRKYNRWLKEPKPRRRVLTGEEIEGMDEEEVDDALSEMASESESEEEEEEEEEEEPIAENIDNMGDDEVTRELVRLANEEPKKEEEEEPDIEVNEMYYKGVTYLVDLKTKKVYNEEGDEIGWYDVDYNKIQFTVADKKKMVKEALEKLKTPRKIEKPKNFNAREMLEKLEDKNGDMYNPTTKTYFNGDEFSLVPDEKGDYRFIYENENDLMPFKEEFKKNDDTNFYQFNGYTIYDLYDNFSLYGMYDTYNDVIYKFVAQSKDGRNFFQEGYSNDIFELVYDEDEDELVFKQRGFIANDNDDAPDEYTRNSKGELIIFDYIKPENWEDYKNGDEGDQFQIDINNNVYEDNSSLTEEDIIGTYDPETNRVKFKKKGKGKKYVEFMYNGIKYIRDKKNIVYATDEDEVGVWLPKERKIDFHME